jgi:putative protease
VLSTQQLIHPTSSPIYYLRKQKPLGNNKHNPNTILLELLAPAKTAEIGIAAINHGADAVYIGAPKFGARKQAANTIDDIRVLIDHAHLFHAKVYITLNTLLFDDELQAAETLIHQLYTIGADALIIQDMGILELNLPPIALHVSTQTDNRTWKKVKFLEETGFEQVVLARELALEQIKDIREKTSVKLECFIHGALCVSYSGQCYMSQAINKRSANRGECAQPCRLPYTLTDKNGTVLSSNKHLLSLKDLNLTDSIADLALAGVTSFKIEGRLKEIDYVKNVTAHYHEVLNHFIDTHPGYSRASSGTPQINFSPNPEKSFNRGFSSYFLNGRTSDIWNIDTPKSLGEKIGKVARIEKDCFIMPAGTIPLSNGDGLCFFNKKMELVGIRVNRANGLSIYPSQLKDLYAGATLFRNHDQAFEAIMANSHGERKIDIQLTFERVNEHTFRLSITDEDNVTTTIDKELSVQQARNEATASASIINQLTKMGGTAFNVAHTNLLIHESLFFPAKELNELRRQAIALHIENRVSSHPRPLPAKINTTNPYPENSLDYKGNSLNKLASQFYTRHDVKEVSPGFELLRNMQGKQVMANKHCILYSMDKCLKLHPEMKKHLPLTLHNNKDVYDLEFDCKACEMKVFIKSKQVSE